MKFKFPTRRDMCFSVGRRCALLTPAQGSEAWAVLAREIEAMGELDVPKFNNLIAAIRKATIAGKQIKP